MKRIFRFKKETKGIALILTIVLTAVLASVCLAFTYNLRVEFLIVEAYSSRIRGSYLAEAGLSCAEILLKKDDASKDHFEEKMFMYSDMASKNGYPEGKDIIKFSIEDENSKLNINSSSTATRNTLINLFRVLEVKQERQGDILDELISSDNAEELADAILDWRDPDEIPNVPGGAEKDYYENLENPYTPPDAPFKSLRELLLVKGFNERIFLQIEDYITVWGNGRINVNTASEQVLKSIDIIQERDDREYVVHLIMDNRPYKNFEEFRNIVGPYDMKLYQKFRGIVHVQSDAFTLTGIGVVNDVEFRIIRVVSRQGSKIRTIYNIRDFLC